MKDAKNVCVFLYNLSISFDEIEGEENQFNFLANLTGFLGEESEDEVSIACVEGAIGNLPYAIGEGINKFLDLEIGDYANSFECLSPLYLSNGELCEKLWAKVGGKDYSTRFMYIEKVEVRKGIISKNLGAELVLAVANKVHKILQDEIPVFAILGSYEERHEAVVRYFRQNGFKPLKPKEKLAHFLPISKIKKYSNIKDAIVYFDEKKRQIKTKQRT